MVLTGLMAREIGGGRRAQLVAAWAVAIAAPAVSFGYLFQYVSFDYLWWVLAAWVTIRLLRSEDQRWWLALGAAVGLGMMTKFTMGLLLAGIVGGIILTRAPLAAQQVFVVRCRHRPRDFPSQSHLAGPARFHHA
jgi:4-amino-4-deoxy-L-arabinose transferase-like glycosyltransferase